MDITLRNELTTPYKIPRKRALDDSIDGSKLGAMKNGIPTKCVQEMPYRSPMLSSSQKAQPSTSGASQRNISANNKQPSTNLQSVSNKRNISRNNTPTSTNVASRIKSGGVPTKNIEYAKIAEKKKGPVNTKSSKETAQIGTTTLDLIMNEMKSLEKDTKKKKKLQQLESPGTEENAPSTSKQFSSSYAAYAPLTRVELMRHENDNTLVHNFLRKETGIMETILGFKMLNGRVEPYASENYAHLRHSGASHLTNMEPNTVHSPVLDSAMRRGPKTPPGKGPRTPDGPGPQTPSDAESNNTIRSSSPKSDAQRLCSPLPPPPAFPTWNDASEQDGRNELLKEMSQLTKTPLKQLEANLGSELKEAIDRVDKSTLFNTLKDALRNMGQKPESNKERNTDFEESQQTKETNEACDAMSISSGGNSLLPPPPPPPLSPPPPASPNVHRPPTPPPSSPPPGNNRDNNFTPKEESGQYQEAAPQFDFFHSAFVTSIAPNTIPTAIIIADPSSIPHLIGASTIPISTAALLPPVCHPPPLFMPFNPPPNLGGVPFMPPTISNSTSCMPQPLPPPPNLQQQQLQQAKTEPQGVVSPLVSPKLSTCDDTGWKPRNKKPRPKPEPTINMDFIRSRPPPIIPDILKQPIPRPSTEPHPLIKPSTNNQPIQNPPPQPNPNPMVPIAHPPMSIPPPTNFSVPPPPIIPNTGNPPSGPPPLVPNLPCPNMSIPPPPVIPSVNATHSSESSNKNMFKLGAHCAARESSESVQSTVNPQMSMPPPLIGLQSHPPPPSLIPNQVTQSIDIPSMLNDHSSAPLSNEYMSTRINTNMNEPPPPSFPQSNVFKTLMSALSKSGTESQISNNPIFPTGPPPNMEIPSSFSTHSKPGISYERNTSSWAKPSSMALPPNNTNSSSTHSNFLYENSPLSRFSSMNTQIPHLLPPPSNQSRHNISPWQFPPPK